MSQPTVARMSQAALRTAFVASMNEQSGQSDLDFQQGSKTAEAVAHDVPLEPRAGYRVTLRNSSASLAPLRSLYAIWMLYRGSERFVRGLREVSERFREVCERFVRGLREVCERSP